MGLDHLFPDGDGVVDGCGKGEVGGHAVVDGDDFDLAVVRHQNGLRRRGLSSEDHVTPAVHVDQQAVTILFRDGVWLHEEDGDAGDGLLLQGDVELFQQGVDLVRFGFVLLLDPGLPLLVGRGLNVGGAVPGGCDFLL